MPAPLPWFPFYVNDWDTDENVRSLTLEERGAYIGMLCAQWREGSLPKRAADVQRSLGLPLPVARRLLRRFFVPHDGVPGRVVNLKLLEVYCHQLSKSEKASQVAREAAARRAANAERTPDNGTAKAGRVRSRIRSQIQKSLKTSAHAEDNGHSKLPDGVL